MTPPDTGELPAGHLRVLRGYQGKWTRPKLVPADVALLHALDVNAVCVITLELESRGLLALTDDGAFQLTDDGERELAESGRRLTR